MTKTKKPFFFIKRKKVVEKSAALQTLFEAAWVPMDEFIDIFATQIDEVERYERTGKAPSPHTVALLAKAKQIKSEEAK
jgi:hypothetical protein